MTNYRYGKRTAFEPAFAQISRVVDADFIMGECLTKKAKKRRWNTGSIYAR